MISDNNEIVDRIPIEFLSSSNHDGTVSLDREDESQFERFSEARISQRSINFIGAVLFCVSTYVLVMSLLNETNWQFVASILISSAVIRNPIVFLLIYYKRSIRQPDPSAFVLAIGPYFHHLMSFISIYSTVGLGLFLIARVVNGPCPELGQLHMWSCNSESRSRALPQETVLCLMMLPILYATVFKSVKSFYVFVSWILTVLFIILAIVIAGATQSIAILVIYVPLSYVALHEVHRQNVILFLMAKKQQLLLDTNRRLADEAQNELRFMIANMAHDLKTPLSSFMNGVETLSSQFEDLITAGEKAKEKEVQDSIKENIRNLFNVNNFMTMTVNRCIDYMKASKGIKLEPRFETINLQEVLSMPVNCMKDLQSRIAIHQKSIPASVSSHVITDLQWFQENLFCLISNAVKYSSHGHITVGLSLTTLKHPRLKEAREKKLAARRDSHTASAKAKATPSSFVGAKSLRAEKYSFLDKLARARQSSSEEEEVAAVAASAAAEIDLEAGQTGVIQSNSSVSSKNSLQAKAAQSALSIYRSALKAKRASSNKVYVSPPPEEVDEEAGDTLQVDIPPELLDEFLLVEVEDTGIGLSDEVKASLFTPFKQAQRRAGGTGLGLYSLANRVDALGGYYGVCNRKNGEQGSLFWFAVPYRADMAQHVRSRSTSQPESLLVDIPASPSAGASALVAAAAGSRKATPTSATVHLSQRRGPSEGKLKILLVDDSMTVLKMTTNLLKKHGHLVDQEENGADALTRLEKNHVSGEYPYDVMLIDLNMPVMDGLEAMKRLRETERQLNSAAAAAAHVGDIPRVAFHQRVFAFSANSDHQTLVEAMEAGADDFLTKPFSIQTFNEKCAKLLR